MFAKKFTKEPTEKQKIGKIGEDYACDYLKKQGYQIIERNYLKKWGEIDIIVKKDKKIHFIEVKTVSRDLSNNQNVSKNNVNHETPVLEQSSLGDKQAGEYRAEDNMHPWKLKRLGRAVQSYLLDRDVPDNIEWQFDVATVHIDISKGLINVLLLEDIVL